MMRRVLMVALMGWPVICEAQAPSGRLAGSIHDPVNAVIPNATVILTNEQTHAAERAAGK